MEALSSNNVSNISGSPLEQLIECYRSKRVRPYPGTLVVLVGHYEEQLLKTYRLYETKKPDMPHSVVMICNGRNPGFWDKHTLSGLFAPVIYRVNTGWDIMMYAEAVLMFKFRRYWFMNDDIVEMADGNWLSEFEHKINRPDSGIVAVQTGSPRNFRTTYFGMTRLHFLMWYVTIHYSVLQKLPHVARRQDKRAATKDRVPGYVQAKEFELYNLTFARVCGVKPRWLRNTRHFIDSNALLRRSFLAKPARRLTWDEPRHGLMSIAGYSIEDLWDGRETLTIDRIIESAKGNDQILY